MITTVTVIGGGEHCDQQSRCRRNHVWGTAEMGRECCGSIHELFKGVHDVLALGTTNVMHPFL
eukprot:7076769-Ditylum_brightwellii.AAC.2